MTAPFFTNRVNKSSFGPVTEEQHPFTPAYPRAGQKSKIAKWLIGGGTLALALVGFWYLSDRHTQSPMASTAGLPVSVEVAAVRRADMPVVERTIGTVVSYAMVQVTAMVPGPLERVYFREGQMVKKGDLLFQIDPRSYQAALDQARGQLAKDQAILEGAQRDLKRDQDLMAAGAGTKQVLEDEEATVQSDEGVVESDKANVDTAAINLGYTQIRSPIDGKTGPILIMPGNVLAVTGTSSTTMPLVTITQIRPVKISFSLPQADLSRIQDRQRTGGLIARIGLRTAEGRTYTAPVDFVGNVVNDQTGTIELRVTLPNKDAALVPGQIVNVAVELNDIPNAIIVPHEAVNDGPAGRYVFAVKNGHAQLRPVKVLFDDSRNVAVKGNLEPGDQVVVDGQLRVVPGAAVMVDSTAQNAADTDSGGAISFVPQ